MNQINPVFVIGHPKSGTSLMNSLLDSHSELIVLSEESDFYNSIWPKASALNQQWRLNDSQKVDLLLKHIIGVTHFQNYFRGKVDKDISGNLDYEDFPKEAFKDSLIENITSSLTGGKFQRKALLASIIESYKSVVSRETKLKKYWVEKTPKHTWYLNQILADFPNSKFIFVHRDPRDNFVSYQKKLGETLTPIHFSKSWNNALDIFETIADSKSKLLIKYEDLILNQSHELQRISQFLGIQNSTELTQPTKLGKSWKGNSMFNLESAGLHSKSIGRFQEKLSKDALITIEYFTKTWLLKCGYTPLNSEEALGKYGKEHAQEIEEFKNHIPFGINAPLTLRSRVGLLRRKILG